MSRVGFLAVSGVIAIAALCCWAAVAGSSARAQTAGEKSAMDSGANIIFLHHSTGNNVWKGGVPQWFERYNAEHGTSYRITERAYPSGDPYAWKNYPFDYWNIWVKHAGPEAYMKEPTLEMLAPEYDVIVFKHCFPVSNILEDTGKPDISSEEKRLENYKLQYAALKEKLHQFPDVKFLVWTGAALVEKDTNPENAKRAREFFTWVKDEWDQPGDNIHIWDLFELETGGGLYLKNEYAEAPDNSHPNGSFCKQVAPQFAQRIVDVIQGTAD